MTSQLIIADIVERKRNISEVWFKKSLALPKKYIFLAECMKMNNNYSS